MTKVNEISTTTAAPPCTLAGDTFVVGWREWVWLEDLAEAPIKAKVDTGALTSSLHAHGLEIRNQDGRSFAEFWVQPDHGVGDHHRVSAPVIEYRVVQSSTGHQQSRPVISTPICVGPHRLVIDVTLTSRDVMGFGMLLGRSALRNRFMVDPSRSFLGGEPR